LFRPDTTSIGGHWIAITRSMNVKNDQLVWIVTDGSVGFEAQGFALAEATGLPFVFKRVRVTYPLSFIPTRLQVYLPPKSVLQFVIADEPLRQPWPRLIISIGRRSVPIALALKQLSDAFVVHIQDPKVPAHWFDLVAAPAHDNFSAPNVITTLGAVHRVTPRLLAEAASKFALQFERLPRPRFAVLLGGDSKGFRFSPSEGLAFGSMIAKLVREQKGSLLITSSRRTRPESLAAFTKGVVGVPHFVWDGSGENPYVAMLAWADFIVVTNDSVNMVTEAAGTGKPVYVKFLAGQSKRNARFHSQMREVGATRPFDGRSVERWSYGSINDTDKVAQVIRRALGFSLGRT
jgi:mitochondrial fission protein ELM1